MHMKFIFNSGFIVFVSFLLLEQQTFAGQNPQTDTQKAATQGMKLDTGLEIFEAACVGCHGPGGRGQLDSTVGFEKPDTFPDFSDCNGSTREKIFDWRATIHGGGHQRGFSQIMPSWSEALSPGQIEKVIQYLRSLCTEPGWPLGELNFPKAIMTEKAFPEDEAVLSGAANLQHPGSYTGELIYEKRLGVKGQLELAAPYGFIQRSNNGWVGGVGDFVAGYKRVLLHSNKTGSILSAQGSIILPTGNKSKDLGTGLTAFEVFGSYGQKLTTSSFLQVQGGAELPVHPTDEVPKAVFLRTAIGKTLAQDGGFGRAWTPMVEFVADRDLLTGAKTNWDIVPEVQVTLSRRQHIRAAFGIQTPLNNTDGRSVAAVFYMLWDWFDGSLKAGW
jgi:mono/diheme cytochrome c family protein